MLYVTLASDEEVMNPAGGTSRITITVTTRTYYGLNVKLSGTVTSNMLTFLNNETEIAEARAAVGTRYKGPSPMLVWRD